MKAFRLCIVCLFAFCLSQPTWAQDTATSSKKSAVEKTNQKAQKAKAKAKADKPKVISEARKTYLLAFLDEHHPELKKLLGKLENAKGKRPWLKGMNQLDNAVKKLEGVKKRSPARYETALDQWKLESRITVAVAELKHKPEDEKRRKKLESLVGKLVDHHLARMKKEREQLRNRVKQVEKKIADTESNRKQTIEKRVKAALPKPKKEKEKEKAEKAN